LTHAASKYDFLCVWMFSHYRCTVIFSYFVLSHLSLFFLLLCSYSWASVLLSLFIRVLVTLPLSFVFSLYIYCISVPPVLCPCLFLSIYLSIYICIHGYLPSVSLSLSLGCTGSGIRGLGPLFCVLSGIGHRLFLRC
jgi:hypothetical protein